MLEALFASMVGRVVRNGVGTVQDPLLQESMSWFGSLVESGMSRWRSVIQSGIRCTAPGCLHPAIGACVICRTPVCMRHSLISAGADQACARCISEAVAASPRRAPRGNIPGNGAMPPERIAEIRKAHLKVLGLKEGATFDEVRDAFRKLGLRHHPDRQQSPAKKEAASVKFKKISESYHWLLEHMKKAAA